MRDQAAENERVVIGAERATRPMQPAISCQQLSRRSHSETSRGFVERNRLTLDRIRRTLAMRDGEAPAEDVLTSPELARLSQKTKGDLFECSRKHRLH